MAIRTQSSRTQLPKLALIGNQFTDPDIAPRIVRAVQYGVRWVHLRDHDAPRDAFQLKGRLLVDRIRKLAPDTLISLNGDPELALELGLGIHAGWGSPATSTLRSKLAPERLLGVSAHNTEEIKAAEEGGADYAMFGHVYDTRSHPGEVARGVAALQTACLEANLMPVIAIGGITAARSKECLEAGASSVAVLSAILQAPNLFEAVDAFALALGDL